MNSDDLKKYLRLRMQQMSIAGGLSTTEVSELVEQAVEFGSVELWTAKSWTFKESQYELTISSEQDAYELDDSIAAVVTAREQASLSGDGLYFVTKDEFDRRVPFPSTHTGGYPQLYTIYSDTKNQKNYIQFFPRPTVTPIYLNVMRKAPGDVSQFPEYARAALVAVCQKYLYIPGTTPFDSAAGLAAREIRKLESEDSPYKEDLWMFFDDTSQRVDTARPWGWGCNYRY